MDFGGMVCLQQFLRLPDVQISPSGVYSLTEAQLDTECYLTSKMLLLQQNVGLTLVMQQKDGGDSEECESSSATLLAIEWGLPVHLSSQVLFTRKSILLVGT